MHIDQLADQLHEWLPTHQIMFNRVQLRGPHPLENKDAYTLSLRAQAEDADEFNAHTRDLEELYHLVRQHLRDTYRINLPNHEQD